VLAYYKFYLYFAIHWGGTVKGQFAA